MAIVYGHLGQLYKTRGDLDQAVTYWTKSRDLFAKIGMPHRVEQVQGLIKVASR